MDKSGHPQGFVDLDDTSTMHINPYGSSFVTGAGKTYTFFLYDLPNYYRLTLSGAQAAGDKAVKMVGEGYEMKARLIAILLLVVSGCLPGVRLTAAPAVQSTLLSAKPAFDYMGGVPPRNEPSGMLSFVTLKPGETYGFDAGVGSFKVYSDEGKLPAGRLGRGTHYLQVKVSTWSYLKDPVPFRRKWMSHGLLWYEGLTSQPMPFTV